MRKRKAVFRTVLLLTALAAVCVMTAAASGYSDTESCWAEEAIVRWTGCGVVQGYADGFRPGAAVTRGQMAMILNNLLRLPGTADAPFTDVADGAVYAEAVRRCCSAGIMLGNNGKAFPAAALTREAAFVILARSLGIPPDETADLSAFRDGARVSGYAASCAAALAKAGVVGGFADGTLAPSSPLSRAQLMAILDRAVVQYIPESGTFELTDRDGIVLVAAGDVTLTGQTSADILISPAAGGRTVAFDGAAVTGSVTVQADGATVSVSEDSRLPEIALNGENSRIERAVPAPSAGSGGDDGDDGNDGGGPDAPEIPGSPEEGGGTTAEHELSDTWVYDDSVHWRTCGVEGCTLRHDCGAHVWDGGVAAGEAAAPGVGVRVFTCTVCHSTRTETIPPAASYGFGWQSPGVLGWESGGDSAAFQIQIHRGTPAGADTLLWSMDCRGSTADLSPALGVLSEQTDTPLTVSLFARSPDGGGLREAGRIASGIEIAVSERLPAPELCCAFVEYRREPGCVWQVYWPSNYQDGTAIWCWRDESEVPVKQEFRVMRRSEMGARVEDRTSFDPGGGDTLTMRMAADSRLREDGVWAVTLSSPAAVDFHCTDVPSGFHLIENGTESMLDLAMTPPRDTDCLERRMTCRYYLDGGEPVLTKNLFCGIRNFPFLEDLSLLRAGENRFHVEIATAPTEEAAGRACLPGRAVFDVCVTVTDLSGTPDRISARWVPRLEDYAVRFSGLRPGMDYEAVLGTEAGERYFLHSGEGGTAEIVLPAAEAASFTLKQWTAAPAGDGLRADIRRVSYPELPIQVAAAPEEIGANGYGDGLEITVQNNALHLMGVPSICSPWLMGEGLAGVRLEEAEGGSFIIPPENAAPGGYDRLFLYRKGEAPDAPGALFSVIDLSRRSKPVRIEQDGQHPRKVECTASDSQYRFAGLDLTNYTYTLLAWNDSAPGELYSLKLAEESVSDDGLLSLDPSQMRLIALGAAEEEEAYLLRLCEADVEITLSAEGGEEDQPPIDEPPII